MPLRAAAMIAERGVRVEKTEKELVKVTGDRKEQVKRIMAEVPDLEDAASCMVRLTGALPVGALRQICAI